MLDLPMYELAPIVLVGGILFFSLIFGELL